MLIEFGWVLVVVIVILVILFFLLFLLGVYPVGWFFWLVVCWVWYGCFFLGFIGGGLFWGFCGVVVSWWVGVAVVGLLEGWGGFVLVEVVVVLGVSVLFLSWRFCKSFGSWRCLGGFGCGFVVVFVGVVVCFASFGLCLWCVLFGLVFVGLGVCFVFGFLVCIWLVGCVGLCRGCLVFVGCGGWGGFKWFFVYRGMCGLVVLVGCFLCLFWFGFVGLGVCVFVVVCGCCSVGVGFVVLVFQVCLFLSVVPALFWVLSVFGLVFGCVLVCWCVLVILGGVISVWGLGGGVFVCVGSWWLGFVLGLGLLSLVFNCFLLFWCFGGGVCVVLWCVVWWFGVEVWFSFMWWGSPVCGWFFVWCGGGVLGCLVCPEVALLLPGFWLGVCFSGWSVLVFCWGVLCLGWVLSLLVFFLWGCWFWVGVGFVSNVWLVLFGWWCFVFVGLGWWLCFLLLSWFLFFLFVGGFFWGGGCVWCFMFWLGYCLCWVFLLLCCICVVGVWCCLGLVFWLWFLVVSGGCLFLVFLFPAPVQIVRLSGGLCIKLVISPYRGYGAKQVARCR